MKNKKLPNVTIAILAYNAEMNIVRLLKALTKQCCKTVVIKKIILLSDASNDKTVSRAKSIKDPRIKIIDNKTRLGFAGGVKKILTSATSDIVVLLNDDVVIKSNLLIERLCMPFIANVRVGLVGGGINPLPSQNLIQKTAELGFVLLKRVYYDMSNIHNNFTCDGKILALSKKFYKNIVFPNNLDEMGNVDSYLYFLCLSYNLAYRFVPEASVYFKFVDNFNDFVKFNIRNIHSAAIIRNTFPKLVAVEPQPDKSFFQYLSKIELFILLPYILILFSLHFWVSLVDRGNKVSFSHVWSVVESTKKLDRI